ncbi:ATP synthase F1 subunit epsilon [Candidatus Roizmanbacteria bacterium RIFCSPHIGHO2_01_FULL_39_12c]|uniref:ATP synthase epsilon chain n=1 Tax=Candidatus Roizmanbacteria bacterium RIFCSPHIGHO2_01_FULL_39_12c TaxID=1802031 RepID=A0A1F7GER5_9BACT|nr:MAG: ATP synthase F1 subunit epsilon [Candidatus Roizmanbacteria bacterium RIFCSPHIGHO2_01_FULL_39_12c]OGK48103.1 MAG: ATP synthase F1 subunit epsilon [Candidatus Roizmanbacteria bacterium RIFCSPLOWO2_01_FULL_40_13]
MLNLRIITPQKVILEKEIEFVTLPTFSGEITVLPHHTNLFAMLVEGIVKIKSKEREDHLAIGGGYLETDGEEVNVLVSRAYGQEQVDQEIILKAIDNAKNILKISRDKSERAEAAILLRRSLVDLKLLKRRRTRSSV